MHGTLAVAALHDRYFGVTPSHRRSFRETYHWSQCTTLFKKWLGPPIREEHKDPIWATAGMISILTFASINTGVNEDAWPLGPRDSVDLDWLRLGTGKMALWHLVDPSRPTSVFRVMSKTFAQMREPPPEQGTDGVPEDLAQLCKLDDLSTRDNNPYFSVAHGLSRLLNVPKSEVTIGRVLMVLAHMEDKFGQHLEKKDPIALVLLCLWYTRAWGNKWWIDLRARYELPAICTYLKRYHSDDVAIQACTPWKEIQALR